MMAWNNRQAYPRVSMNPNEHQLQYPWGDLQPEPGRAQQVADGVKWIRMPLPFALDHINLWLLRDELDGRQGWTVVDCGISRRSEEHTSELQSLMRISYAVFCLKKKHYRHKQHTKQRP